MNISQAKEQIKNAMRVYFARDEYGTFRIPPEEQRPVFLMGPPGIGKTAIMKQIADEMGVSLVSYSMTHHTRQSALGLPVIVHRDFDGMDCTVTEYTMSEIIASVYETIADTGCREGILFLDEINCVSETLTPTMLQFLQYKTFGRHAVPDGWIVVTAGNPTEFNRAAREFDIVTWDRLKRIDIEPDYAAWKEYALKKGVHAAITTYLDARKQNFYRIETAVDGKQFITARGWVDLSEMIKLYEEQGIAVDRALVGQYVRIPAVADDFIAYYDLFNKYKSDYQIGSILSGNADESIIRRAKDADFDERLSLIGLLLDTVNETLRRVVTTEDTVTGLLDILRRVKAGADISDEFSELDKRYSRDRRRGALNRDGQQRYDRMKEFLTRHIERRSDFAAIKADYDSMVKAMKDEAKLGVSMLSGLFGFAEKVWQEGQEQLLIVTELTANYYSARFISHYGCEEYYRHSEELMFYQRQTEIIRELRELEEI